MKTLDSLKHLSLNLNHNTLSALLYKSTERANQEKIKNNSKMPSLDLTDLIFALLNRVARPHHRRHGGQCHRRPRPAPSIPPLASAPPRSRVLERPPPPSPDRPAYRSMEPSYPDASLWGRRGRPCAVHGWGPCPNRVALAHGPLSSGQQGEAVGEEDELHQILTVTGLVQASLTHRMARISISPRG
jgi:hypothetical protein